MIGAGAVMASLLFMNFGAACAKTLFPAIGAFGATMFRVSLSAVILMVVLRPWRRPFSLSLLPALLVYGAMLAMMNILIYQSFERIPIGIGTGIEITGPLLIVLLGSRRPRDYLWLFLAVSGLLLLLPLYSNSTLNPWGIAFACGAAVCWALYIVYGSKIAGALGTDAVAWGLLIASCITLPVGIATVDPSRMTGTIIFMGFIVAIFSSALPYSLEMLALRRIPPPVFGLLLSSAPAIAALAGFFMLGEKLTGLQWVAIGCIVAASAGSALTARQK
ncbi:MAG: EamA family transporter [Sphingobium sp.]|nr:EamA family transporter [Sphingobium sp.]